MNKDLKKTIDAVIEMCRTASNASDVTVSKACGMSFERLNKKAYNKSFNPYKEGSDLFIEFELLYKKLHSWHMLNQN